MIVFDDHEHSAALFFNQELLYEQKKLIKRAQRIK